MYHRFIDIYIVYNYNEILLDMNNIFYTIKVTKGKYNSLDRSYQNLILESTKDEKKLERWEIYSVIIDELILLGGALEFQKIKYKLTGGEDPNQIMLEIIDTYSPYSELLPTLRIQIESFIDEDWGDRFFN